MTTADPRQIEYLPLSSLKADPRNPKAHDQDTIDASIGRFGVLDPIVQDQRTGYIVSGHGRHKSFSGMSARGESAPEGVKVDPETGEWLVPVMTGWGSRTDAEAGAALIALNRTTELGGWVDDELLSLLDELSEIEGGFDGIGFDESYLEQIEELSRSTADLGDPWSEQDRTAYEDADEDDELEEDGFEEAPNLPTGQAFKLLDVTVGEPTSKVHWGEVYRLGGRHLLVVAKLAREHHKWADLLEGRVFAPYADVYLLLGSQPKNEDFLVVQPNFYLAGHTLDKWKSVHGEETVELLEVRP